MARNAADAQCTTDSEWPAEAIAEVAGSASGMNAMSLTTVAALVGRKAAAAYVAVIVIGAILCGIAINLVPDALPATSVTAAAGHSLSAVHWASAAFLAAMIAYNLVRPVGMGHSKCSAH